MTKLTNLSKNDLVRGLPRLNFKSNHLCNVCQKGKLTKNSFKSINVVSTKNYLELLHMDLFGPSSNKSFRGKRHAFVIVDDYSRFTWVFFLAHKHETFSKFVKFCKKIQKQTSFIIIKIHSDHDKEFKNEHFAKFCDEHGIEHDF